MAEEQKKDTRQMLLSMTKGGTQFYYIHYSVDIKGNITIWDGEPLEVGATNDFLMYCATEDFLHLYDRGRRGRDLIRMEQEAAENVPREKLVAAYLDFRRQHPNDGCGFITTHMAQQEGDSSKKAHRNDRAEIKQELKRRNRQYIAELYGDILPDDFDFYADYTKRLEDEYRTAKNAF